MNLKKFVLNSLLLGIGALLHQITPSLVLGMKPDFSLVMLFIVILFNSKNFKICIISGLVVGIFSALTTGFPGGQIANIIDKLVTTIVIFLFIRLIGRRVKEQILMIGVLFVGTLISGLVFLFFASIIAGLPLSFFALVVSIVMPATLLNTIVGVILYKAIRTSMKLNPYSFL
ncbi:tryptophan transporter [Clostridium sp. D2Q-14]|uniref:tryptophan transporter n=1 Tax=Anaeromonas gelatinilytica TaxID=2683194 RepID=UPI00193C07DB|nr:tryptophan transporter [Anaeromonas gelatinilytica]MBS4535805.1 tryptophan transporter [Anaeromonas gelatinilytica]